MTLLTPAHLPTKTVPFGPDATRANLRYLLQQIGLGEGVIDPLDLRATQRAAGANMSVDVNAGEGWVQGDQAARQGLYFCVNDAVANVAWPAAHATLPRLDRLVLSVPDSSISGNSDIPTFSVVQGVAAAGATLDNKLGANPVPLTAMPVANVLVRAAATTIVSTDIRDQRPWAKGRMRYDLTIAAGGSLDVFGIDSAADLGYRLSFGFHLSLGGAADVGFRLLPGGKTTVFSEIEQNRFGRDAAAGALNPQLIEGGGSGVGIPLAYMYASGNSGNIAGVGTLYTPPAGNTAYTGQYDATPDGASVSHYAGIIGADWQDSTAVDFLRFNFSAAAASSDRGFLLVEKIAAL